MPGLKLFTDYKLQQTIEPCEQQLIIGKQFYTWEIVIHEDGTLLP